MIVGIGTDIVDVRRITAAIGRHGQRFTHRIFTENERAYAQTATNQQRMMLRYANRFAAKEAAYKALGGGSLSWRDVEVVRNTTSGKPMLHFYDAAIMVANALLVAPDHRIVMHLSLSDDAPYCVAFVVLTSLPNIAN